MSYITASRCTLCGDGIYLHVNGHTSTALDRIDSQLLTTDRNDPHHPQPRTVLIDHVCDPGTREAHEGRMLAVLDTLERRLIENPIEDEPITSDQIEHLRAQAACADEEHRAAVRAIHDELTLLSYDRPCPRCGVGEGAACENLTKRKQGIHQATKNPHAERVPDVEPTSQERLQRLHEDNQARHDDLTRLEQELADQVALPRIQELLQEIRDRI